MRVDDHHNIGAQSFKIRAQGADQIVGRAGLFIGRRAVAGEDVITDVAFDDLGHQRVHRAPAGRDVVQDVGAVRALLVEGLLDCGNLPHDPADPVQELFLFLYRVCHKNVAPAKITTKKTLQEYPGGYTLSMGDRTGQAHNPTRKEAHLV